ncbi:phospholipase A and acyltransferase 3-like [Scomber scombrus]|uniref:Phospholipase A and acyltransferase 3-like n=1 Tax=Scomber scombrus TaxID=13677 RepID=A0AAV1P2C2_SCOSC|nr:phospholipase A and acyltransferase 4-like [Scomber scombrus]
MAPTLFDDEVKPGDLIEIFRNSFQHWAIYIGGNEVVHLIPPNADNYSSPFANLAVCLDSTVAEVRRQKIWDVVKSDSYEVNNLMDDEYEPRDRRTIVREACRMVGEHLPYNVVNHNCEHFVTELRYGKSESRQVKTAAAVAGVAAVGVGVAAFAMLGAALFSSLKDEKRRRHYDDD